MEGFLKPGILKVRTPIRTEPQLSLDSEQIILFICIICIICIICVICETSPQRNESKFSAMSTAYSALHVRRFHCLCVCLSTLWSNHIQHPVSVSPPHQQSANQRHSRAGLRGMRVGKMRVSSLSTCLSQRESLNKKCTVHFLSCG